MGKAETKTQGDFLKAIKEMDFFDDGWAACLFKPPFSFSAQKVQIFRKIPFRAHKISKKEYNFGALKANLWGYIWAPVKITEDESYGREIKVVIDDRDTDGLSTLMLPSELSILHLSTEDFTIYDVLRASGIDCESLSRESFDFEVLTQD
jgi:hypothetical protein